MEKDSYVSILVFYDTIPVRVKLLHQAIKTFREMTSKLIGEKNFTYEVITRARIGIWGFENIHKQILQIIDLMQQYLVNHPTDENLIGQFQKFQRDLTKFKLYTLNWNMAVCESMKDWGERNHIVFKHDLARYNWKQGQVEHSIEMPTPLTPVFYEPQRDLDYTEDQEDIFLRWWQDNREVDPWVTPPEVSEQWYHHGQWHKLFCEQKQDYHHPWEEWDWSD